MAGLINTVAENTFRTVEEQEALEMSTLADCKYYLNSNWN